jgi:hypothetical protein
MGSPFMIEDNLKKKLVTKCEKRPLLIYKNVQLNYLRNVSLCVDVCECVWVCMFVYRKTEQTHNTRNLLRNNHTAATLSKNKQQY